MLGKGVTTYWCVPGMFFGDKRVTDPKIEQNDDEFEINVNRNTVCHLQRILAIKQQFEAQV